MNAVNKLLDKAVETCSPAKDIALAEKLGVTRQLVNQWRKGTNPLSDERIAQLAKLANEDAGTWLVLVRAEQAQGEAKKEWAKLAKHLGAAAALFAVALLPLASGVAKTFENSGFAAATNAYYVNSTQDPCRASGLCPPVANLYPFPHQSVSTLTFAPHYVDLQMNPGLS
jgi:transcriptional regulator with XRE-family HTH domain